MFPPTPWAYRDARVVYQPAFVRAEAAREATPSRVRLLSLLGWTLGGIFVAEWTNSPIGPYREVAVLSGLVARGFELGAWASHFVVTTPEAARAGRDVYGLPANLGSIQLDASGDGVEIQFASETDVRVSGWTFPAGKVARFGAATLPSFSGLIHGAPLLRYPLTLEPRRAPELRPSLVVTNAPLDVLSDFHPASPALAVGGVDVTAGVPVEVRDSLPA